jgi:putative hemolysin
MEQKSGVIDIAKAFRSSNKRLFRSLPRFVIRAIEKLIRQDEMNAAIHRSSHLEGVPFLNDILEGWNVKVHLGGEKNISSSGRYIFASNHPVGGIDALSVYSIIGRFFKDVKSPSNELLYLIPNIRPVMVGINVFGKNTREAALRLEELFESETQIMIFPSGEVSRRVKGVISDPVWQKTFITKAIQHKRDIVPVHVSGRNSNLFYFVANIRKFLGIKMYVETLLLPREMMKQRNTTVTVTIGQVIPWQTLTSEKSHSEWARYVKESVYALADQTNL